LNRVSTVLHNETFFLQESAPHARRLLTTSHNNNTTPPSKPLATHDRKLQATTVVNTDVSSETVFEWSQGPYAWPPNFVYWDTNNSCAVASTTLSVVKHGLEVTIKFYKEPPTEPKPAVWPTLPVRLQAADWSNVSLPTSFDDLSAVAQTARDTLSTTTSMWLDEDAVRSFLADAPYMATLKRLVQCNFLRVQTCTERHSFFWTAVQTLAAIVVLAVLLKAAQVPYTEVILFACAVPVFMYLTYGYSPTCLPLIPTCLLSDLFDLVDWMLPASIQWPDALVTEPGCDSIRCMRSCTDDPLVGFASYNDHAAWIMCEANPTWAVDTALSSMAGGNPLRMAILRKCADPSTWSAQRVCFGITLVNSLPLIALFSLTLWLLPTVCTAALSGVQFAINTAFTLVLFVHAGHE
jgi:hypothetical protein